MSSPTAQRCSPTCEFFKCGQRALFMHSGKPFCRWADDDCQGPTCSYASCVRGRLLADGTCGASLKRRTLEEKGPEEELPSVKLKGRILRKVSEEEIF